MKDSSMLLLLAVTTILSSHGVRGFSSGPPVGSNFNLVCNQMTPNPTNHGGPQSGDGGYRLEIGPAMTDSTGGFAYTGGQQYTIRIVGTTGASTIRGFLVQARVPGNGPPDAPMLLGTFVTEAGNQGILDCDMAGASMATIAHSSSQGDVGSVQFTWTAPAMDGNVNFYYTVVRIRATHFDALSASEVGVDFVTEPPTTPTPTDPLTSPGQTNPPTTPGPTDPPTTPGPTEPPTTPGPTQPPPDNTVAPQRSPEDYRLVLTFPNGCTRVDCDVFIGIDTNTGNSGYLDIYMEGTADGWVAVGFSETSNMYSSDVVACNRFGNDMVALDTWNEPEFNRASPTDSVQDVYFFSGSFVNGRLSCKVTKRITPSDQFDLNLNSSLYVIYGRRTSVSSSLMSINSHDNFQSSSTRGSFQILINPVSDITPTDAPPVNVTLPPGNAVAPQRSLDDYRFQIGVPDGCSRAQCDIFIGIDTNAGDNGFLDIYLEGTAEGWVAVGFSETSNMYSADVVACNRVGDDITALDTWNVPSLNRGSPSDIIQDVTLFASSFTDGRISCTVAKRIAPSDQFDLDLNNNLYVIYARRLSASFVPSTIDSHAGGGMQVRSVSGAQVNPAQAVGGAGVNVFEVVHRRRLTQAHGALMIIAWPLLAVTAIFFAAFMKPALPNGEWFQVHRALLICSMIVGTSGFVLIFIALKNQNGLVNVSSNTSLAHLIIGVIVMALQFANPIIALFRCKPNGDYRWIFNLLHGSLVGSFAGILALINIGLGIAIFSQTTSRFSDTLAPLWLYVSWAIFYLVLIPAIRRANKNLAPSLAKYFISSPEKPKDMSSQGVELKQTGGGEEKSEKVDVAPERKPPSKDASLRWIGLASFLTATLLVMLVLIILIGLPL